MKTSGSLNYVIKSQLCYLLLLFDICGAGTQYVGKIYPGFEGSQINWVDNCGLFLLSNNSIFALGFYASLDVTLFLLVIIHIRSAQVVWTANRGHPVKNTEKFVFEDNGNAYLGNPRREVWSSNTAYQGVTAMELQDNGNLVILGSDGNVVWESFSHPTDTLLPGQEFVQGMKLKSFPRYPNLYYYLEIDRGDMILYAGYRTPQIYWSTEADTRKIVKKTNGGIHNAFLVSNSWSFYDHNHSLVWQFNISDYDNKNATWAAVLGTDGSISFYNLERGKPPSPEPFRIPQGYCSTPDPCIPYRVCSFDNRCQCPSPLASYPHCTVKQHSSCNGAAELLGLGEGLNYFALPFVAPSMKSHLNGCKEACLGNCSCLVMFHDNTTGKCFMFDHIGSLKRSALGSTGFSAFLKVPGDGADTRKGKEHTVFVVVIAIGTVFAILGLIYLGYRFIRLRKKPKKPTERGIGCR